MSEKKPTVEEQARDELKLARKQKEFMEILLNSEPYKYMVSVLKEQIEFRTRKILEMPESQDDLIKKTYSSGEIAGITIAMDFPTILLEGAKETINIAKRQEELNSDGTEEQKG